MNIKHYYNKLKFCRKQSARCVTFLQKATIAFKLYVGGYNDGVDSSNVVVNSVTMEYFKRLLFDTFFFLKKSVSDIFIDVDFYTEFK